MRISQPRVPQRVYQEPEVSFFSYCVDGSRSPLRSYYLTVTFVKFGYIYIIGGWLSVKCVWSGRNFTTWTGHIRWVPIKYSELYSFYPLLFYFSFPFSWSGLLYDFGVWGRSPRNDETYCVFLTIDRSRNSSLYKNSRLDRTKVKINTTIDHFTETCKMKGWDELFLFPNTIFRSGFFHGPWTRDLETRGNARGKFYRHTWTRSKNRRHSEWKE